MPFGTDAGLDPCGTVLDAAQLPDGKGHNSPQFSAHFALALSPISATAELLFNIPPFTAEIMSTNVSCNNLYYCQITELVVSSSQLQSYEFSSNSIIR